MMASMPLILHNEIRLSEGMLGTIGGGKAKISGKIDIALMQSLSHKNEVKPRESKS